MYLNIHCMKMEMKTFIQWIYSTDYSILYFYLVWTIYKSKQVVKCFESCFLLEKKTKFKEK